MGRKVEEGDWCIVKVNEGAKYIVVEVRNKGQVKILKKKSFSLALLIGRQFGEHLELDKKGNLTPWDRSNNVQASKVEEEEYSNAKIGDNRNVKRNDPSVQSLSYEEIEDMKKNTEVKGTEMIEKLSAANVAFESKTVFSKEKYLRKKQQRHLSVIQIVRPTARTIAEAYFGKAPGKIFYIRPDSVAQVLSLGNVTSGDNILLTESCAGLVVGAVTERLGGRGNIISLFMEQEAPVNNAYKCFNFSETVQSTYIPVPFHQFETLANTPLQDFTAPPENFPFKKCKRLDIIKRARDVMQTPVDSLIITSKFNPAEILFELFKYVRGSGHIVIFHPFLEPLIECHEMLHDSGEAINIELRESWFRDYQVLPLRTHPLMKMHGASGYLLSAIKVQYVEKTKSRSYGKPQAKKGNEPQSKRQKVE